MDDSRRGVAVQRRRSQRIPLASSLRIGGHSPDNGRIRMGQARTRRPLRHCYEHRHTDMLRSVPRGDGVPCRYGAHRLHGNPRLYPLPHPRGQARQRKIRAMACRLGAPHRRGPCQRPRRLSAAMHGHGNLLPLPRRALLPHPAAHALAGTGGNAAASCMVLRRMAAGGRCLPRPHA